MPNSAVNPSGSEDLGRKRRILSATGTTAEDQAQFRENLTQADLIEAARRRKARKEAFKPILSPIEKLRLQSALFHQRRQAKASIGPLPADSQFNDLRKVTQRPPVGFLDKTLADNIQEVAPSGNPAQSTGVDSPSLTPPEKGNPLNFPPSRGIGQLNSVDATGVASRDNGGLTNDNPIDLQLGDNIPQGQVSSTLLPQNLDEQAIKDRTKLGGPFVGHISNFEPSILDKSLRLVSDVDEFLDEAPKRASLVAKAAFNESITGVAYEMVFGERAFDLSGYDPGVIERLASTVLSFIMPIDALLLVGGGGVGGVLAKKIVPSVVRKLVAAGVSEELATRTVASAIKSATALGTYEGARPAIQGKFSEVPGAVVHGGAMGFLLGTSAGLSATSGLAVKVGSEIGTFTVAGAALEGRLPNINDLESAVGIVLGLRLQGRATAKIEQVTREMIVGKVLEGKTLQEATDEVSKDKNTFDQLESSTVKLDPGDQSKLPFQSDVVRNPIPKTPAQSGKPGLNRPGELVPNKQSKPDGGLEPKPSGGVDKTAAGDQVSFSGKSELPRGKIRSLGKKTKTEKTQGDAFNADKIKRGNLPQDQVDLLTAPKADQLGFKVGSTVEVTPKGKRKVRRLKVEDIVTQDGVPVGVKVKGFPDLFKIEDVQIPQATLGIRAFHESIRQLPKEEQAAARKGQKEFDDILNRNTETILTESEIGQVRSELPANSLGPNFDKQFKEALKEKMRDVVAEQMNLGDLSDPVLRFQSIKILKQFIENGAPRRGDITSLSKAENTQLRKDFGLDDLPQAERETRLESMAKAKQGRFDANAEDIAAEVIRKPRPLSTEEHVGMVLRVRELRKQHKESLKLQGELIEDGDFKAADVELGRSENLINQIGIITDGTRQGRSEIARALSAGNLKVSEAGIELSDILVRGRNIVKGKLSPKQESSLTKPTEDYLILRDEVDKLKVENEKLLAEQDKKIAENIVRRRSKRASSQSVLKAKQSELKKQIAALGFRVNDITGVSAEGAYLIGKLAVSYARSGAKNLEAVIERVRQDIPDLTEQDVIKSIASKDPKAQLRAKSEATKRVIALKIQARLLVKIEEAERGIFSKSKPRAEQSIEITSLQKRLRELRKQAYRSGITSERLEKALSTIDELNDQLVNFRRSIKKKITIDPPEIANAKSKIKELRQTIRVADEIADLNEQLRTGDFKIPKLKESPRLSPQLERKIVEMNIARKKVRIALEALEPLTTGKIALETANTLRTAKATADISAVGRQGFLPAISLSIRNPKLVGQAFNKSLKALFSEHTAEQIDAAMRAVPHQYRRVQAELFLAERGDGKLLAAEESFMSKVLEKIPVIREIVQASERHMVTYLNLLRADAFDQFLIKYPNATNAELKIWAGWINVMSGRGAISRGLAEKLSGVLFSPRFTASRLQAPVYITKALNHPRVLKEISKDYIATASVMVTALALANYAGLSVGLDQRESDFLKIRFGDTRIDLGAGLQQSIRLVLRIGTIATDRVGVTGKDLSDVQKDLNPLDLAYQFSRYKLGPVITLPVELFTGKNAVGEERTLSESAARSFIPIVIEDVFEAYKQAGGRAAAVSGGLGVLGVGVNTFPDSESRIRRDIIKSVSEGDISKAENIRIQFNTREQAKGGARSIPPSFSTQRGQDKLAVKRVEREVILLLREGKTGEAKQVKSEWDRNNPDNKLLRIESLQFKIKVANKRRELKEPKRLSK